MAMPAPDGASAVAFWSTLPEPVRLADQDWLRVQHLFSKHDIKRGRPRRPDREILDAILWVEANGNKWHRLPCSYPPAQTCYAKYVAWRRDGLLERVKDLLACALDDAQECA